MEKKYDKIREQLKFYLERGKAVHISSWNLSWYNGKVMKVNETSVFLDERKQGVKILFFEDIKTIEPMKELEK